MAMPLAEASAREGRRPGRLAAPPKMLLGSCSILFVDDDEAFSYAAAKVLRTAGYKVWLAHDYRNALQILESRQPLDLLITIVMRNGVNGFALARMARMRRLDLKILYLTAFDFPAEEAAGKIVRKPIPLELLVFETRRALGGKCYERD
jgi:CheY-like chemotaxis protein